jgi:hypothetical protein
VSDFPRTPTNRPHRLPERVGYDRGLAHSILDETLICHVGYDAGGPVVLPMIHARMGDSLYLHASTGSGLSLSGLPAPVCVTATVIDALVLAKSQFHHSMNYRSVVVRGTAAVVTDPDERDRALAAIVDHVSPGRTLGSRAPNRRELAATAVLRVPMESVATKQRTGGPHDDAEDEPLPFWSGVIPMRLVAGEPEPMSDPATAAPPAVDPRFGGSIR